MKPICEEHPLVMGRAKVRTVNHGFTLIELLVVIAIISILAAFLFPVFSKARESARRSSCTSNIKQLMLAFTLYTHDCDENLPQWKWGQSNVAGDSDPNDATNLWVNAIYPYVKSAVVYKCPDDSSSDGTTGLNGWFTQAPDGTITARGMLPALSHVALSYGANEPLLDSNTSAAADPEPASTFLLADSALALSGADDDCYSDWQAASASGNPLDPRLREPIIRIAYPEGMDGIPNFLTACNGPIGAAWTAYARHNTGNNVGFVDGHVKWLPVTKMTISLYGVVGNLN